MTPALSVIIPTIGRPSLAAALASLGPAGMGERDEAIVVTDGMEATEDAFVVLADAKLWDEHWSVGVSTKGEYGLTGRLATWLTGGRFLVVEGPETRDSGNAQRQYGIARACGSHVVYLDDDDVLLPGALDAIRGALLRHPRAPLIVRQLRPSGVTLPGPDNRIDPDLDESGGIIRGRIGSPNLVAPRDAHLAPWGTGYCADWRHIEATLAAWKADGVDPVFLPHVTTLVSDDARGWGSLYVTTLVNEVIQPDAFKTWIRFVGAGGRAGDVIEDDPVTRKEVGVARNRVVRRFLDDPALAHCGSLCFVDSDMVFAPGALEAMRSDPAGWSFDVLCGLYRARESGLQLVLRERETLTPGEPPFDVLTGWEPGQVVPVDVTPMGFTLIRRRVLEAKQEQWFYAIRGAGTEDVGFSRDASLAGFRLGVHTGVGVGHLTTTILPPT